MRNIPFGLSAVIVLTSQLYGGYIHKKEVTNLFKKMHSHRFEMLRKKELFESARDFIKNNFTHEISMMPNWEMGLQKFLEDKHFARDLEYNLTRSDLVFDVGHYNMLTINFHHNLPQHRKIFTLAVFGAILGHYARVESHIRDTDFQMSWTGSNLPFVLSGALGYHLNRHDFNLEDKIKIISTSPYYQTITM